MIVSMYVKKSGMFGLKTSAVRTFVDFNDGILIEYSYNFGWMPNKCVCKRCGMKWKTINNPNYDFRTSNPLSEDMHIWLEDK